MGPADKIGAVFCLTPGFSVDGIAAPVLTVRARL